MSKISVEVDGSGVASGVRTVKRDLAQLKTSADNVYKSFDKLNKEINNIGAAQTGRTSKKLERDFNSLSKSISSTNEILVRQNNILNDVSKQFTLMSSRIDYATKTNNNFNRTVSTSTSGLNSLKTALAAVTASFGLRELQDYSDSWKQVTSLVRLATDSEKELLQNRQELVNLSLETRTDLKAQTTLYNRLTIAQKNLGASQREIMTVIGTVGRALGVTATSALEARGSLIQLSQAFGQGIVRAEEFNSIIEGTPKVAQAIAEGLGLTTAELRSLVLEGQVTSKAFFNALLSQSDELRKEFANVDKTISQVFTNLKTNLTVAIGELDEATGASKSFVNVIENLNKNIRETDFEQILNDSKDLLGTFGDIILILGVGRVGYGIIGGIAAVRAGITSATSAATLFNTVINSNAIAIGILGAAFVGTKLFEHIQDSTGEMRKLKQETIETRIQIAATRAEAIGSAGEDVNLLRDILGDDPKQAALALKTVEAEIDKINKQIVGAKRVGKSSFFVQTQEDEQANNQAVVSLEKRRDLLQDIFDTNNKLPDTIKKLSKAEEDAASIKAKNQNKLNKQVFSILNLYSKEKDALEATIVAGREAATVRARLPKITQVEDVKLYKKVLNESTAAENKAATARKKIQYLTDQYNKALKAAGRETEVVTSLSKKLLSETEKQNDANRLSINQLNKEATVRKNTLIATIQQGEKAKKSLDKLYATGREGSEEFESLQEQLNKRIEEGAIAEETLFEVFGLRVKGTKDGYNELSRVLASFFKKVKEEDAALAKIDKEQQRRLKRQQKEWQKFYEDGVDFASDSLSTLFKDGSDGWDDMLDSWNDTFLDTVAKMVAQDIVVPIVFDFLGGGQQGVLNQVFAALGYNATGAIAGGTQGKTLLAGQNLPVGQLFNLFKSQIPGAGLLNTILPGTGLSIDTTSAAAQLGLKQAGTQFTVGGTTLGTALGYGGVGALGYNLLGGQLGLPQNIEAQIGSSIGGALGGTYAGGALATAGLGALGGPIGIALGALAGGLLGGVFEDEKRPDVRVGSLENEVISATTHDISGGENRRNIENAVELYFNQRFDELDKIVNFSVEDALKGGTFRGRVRLDKIDEEDPTSLFTSLVRSAFTEEQTRGEYQGNLRDIFLDAMGLSGDIFSFDFFEGIQLDSEDLITTFGRFADVAEEFSDFNSRFASQVEEGFTKTQAFQNFSNIVAVIEQYNNIIEGISTSTVSQNLRNINTQWDELVDTLEKSGATAQELSKIEKSRNVVVGSQLTGITANSLTQALIGGNFKEVFVNSLKAQAGTVLASSLSETLFSSAFEPILEQIGGLSSTLIGGNQEDIVNAWSGIISQIEGVVSGIDLEGFYSDLEQLGITLDDADINERRRLEAQILKLEGRELESTNLLRQIELDETKDSLKPLKERIFLLEDENKRQEEYNSLMESVNKSLLDLSMSPFEKSLYDIQEAYEENIKTAKKLGVTQGDLNKIERLRTESIQSILRDLQTSIQDELATLGMSDTEQQIYSINKQYQDTVAQIKAIEEMTDKTSSGLDVQTKAQLNTTNAINIMNENVSNMLKAIFDLIQGSASRQTRPSVQSIQDIALGNIDLTKLEGAGPNIIEHLRDLSKELFGSTSGALTINAIKEKVDKLAQAPSYEDIEKKYPGHGTYESSLIITAKKLDTALEKLGDGGSITALQDMGDSGINFLLDRFGFKSIPDIKTFIEDVFSAKDYPSDVILEIQKYIARSEGVGYRDTTTDIALPTLTTGDIASSAEELRIDSLRKLFNDFFSGIHEEYEQLGMSDIEKSLYALNTQREQRLKSLNSINEEGILTIEEYTTAQKEINALYETGTKELQNQNIITALSGIIQFNTALDDTYQVTGRVVLALNSLGENDFPILSGGIDLLNAAITSTEDGVHDTASSLVAFSGVFDRLNVLLSEGSITTDQYNSILSTTSSLYTKSLSQIKKNRNDWNSFADSIDSWFNKLSPVSMDPREIYLSTQKAFKDTYEKAQAGDIDAQKQLTGVADDFLKASLEYNTDQAAYYGDFGVVKNLIDKARVEAKEQVSSIDEALNVAKDQVVSLKNIETFNSESLFGIRTLDSSILALQEIIPKDDLFNKLFEQYLGGSSTLSELLSKLTEAQSNLSGGDGVTPPDGGGGVKPSLIDQLEARYPTLDFSEGGTYKGEERISFKNVEGTGGGDVGVNLGFDTITQLLDPYYKVPAFSTGGYHAGGMRLVGEDGPEFEVTAPSYIHNNTDTANLLGRQYMEEMADEIKKLREDLRAANAANVKANAQTAFYIEREYIEKNQVQ